MAAGGLLLLLLLLFFSELQPQFELPDRISRCDSHAIVCVKVISPVSRWSCWRSLLMLAERSQSSWQFGFS